MARALSLFTIIGLTIASLVSGAPTATAGPVNEVEPRVQVAKRGETFHGTATYFHPATNGGPIGACGPRESDSSHIVALNAPQYGKISKKSSWCGKKVKITGPHGTTIATINDACPECSHGSLDLTPVLFKKVVGDYDIGEGHISWSVL
jgi:expansin (peptidoglycan-binding protein)